jgi:hypothetical protein
MYLDDDINNPNVPRMPIPYYTFLGRQDLIEKMNQFDNKVLVASVEEAQDYILSNGCPNFISFDNDLRKELEGIHLAHWLVEKDLDNEGHFIPDDFDFIVHSQNGIASQRIVSYLESYLNSRSKPDKKLKMK